MSWFKSLGIRARLLVSFGLVLILTAGLGAFTLARMSAISDAAAEIGERYLPSTRALGAIDNKANALRRKELVHITLNERAEMEKVEQDIQGLTVELAENEKAYEKLARSDEERKRFADYKRAWESYEALRMKVLALSREGDNDAARDVARGSGLREFEAASKALGDLIQLNGASGEAAAETAKESNAQARVWVIGFLALALLIGVVLALAIASSIARAIGQAVQVVDGIASAASQVSAAAQTVSQGTGEQAASVEETTSSLEQMSASCSRTPRTAGRRSRWRRRAPRTRRRAGRPCRRPCRR